MHAHVGDASGPLIELRLKVSDVDEAPSRQEVALDVLDAGFDLALWSARDTADTPAARTPSAGQTPEGRFQRPCLLCHWHTVRGRSYRCSRVSPPKCSKAASWASRTAHLLVGAHPVVAAPAVAQRQHEHVQLHRLLAQVGAHLPPVDLALLPRRGLEADLTHVPICAWARNGDTTRFTV